MEEHGQLAHEVGAKHEWMLVNLFPGTQHSFSVCAENRLGCGAQSETLTISTEKDVPGRPAAPIQARP